MSGHGHRDSQETESISAPLRHVSCGSPQAGGEFRYHENF